jgi:hypothetical protein
VASISDNHPRNCEEAKRHRCRCTRCGGSLHGWTGWLDLANGSAVERHARRQNIDAQWRKHYQPPQKQSNVMSRSASTDSARLDIADWLACQELAGGEAPPEIPAPRPPHTTTVAPVSGFEPLTSGEKSVPAEVVRSGDQDGDGFRVSPPDPAEPTESRAYPSPVEQVTIFAQAMTTSIWDELAAALGDDTNSVREIKRQLANHGWCDLFIGLVQVIETYQELLDRIPASAKHIVKQAIRNSSMQSKRSYVTDAVVDIVVDRVWSAFKGAMFTQCPLLEVITGEDAVRSLRILAVFICPAPEDHQEVRDHALKPLGDDVRRILTDETKERLAKLFNEWTQTIDEPGLTAPRSPNSPHLRAAPNAERSTSDSEEAR